MKNYYVYIALALICVTTSACGLRDTKAAKSTKTFYFTYVNKPVNFEFKKIDSLNAGEKDLAVRFARLDRELTSLERAMDGVVDPSKQEALVGLLNSYPWVSNTYVIGPDETILGAIPSTAPNVISFTYLAEREVATRQLYAEVLQSNTGPILLIARPYLLSDDLVGYLGVSFDPRNLLPFVGDSSDVFILTPDTVLWSGNHLLSDTPLSDIDWLRTIDRKSSGTVSHGDFKATWVVRYLAGIPLIFGVVE